MTLDDTALEVIASEGLSAARTIKRLLRALPARGAIECVHFELKLQFTPGPREWAELARDLVAFANTGGGVILFGVRDNCRRVGLTTTLVGILDPAKITDQLRRKAPAASVTTAYVEVTDYRKLFGALIIRPVALPLVFDTQWGFNDEHGTHQLVIRPGLIYVRTPGRSGPARQADVREMWQRSVEIASQRTLARIERVASLPPDAELIVSNPESSDEGFVLVSGGEGRPVRIVDDPQAPAVRLDEALSSDTPYSSIAGELASQVRHWQQADPDHRVSKHALLRWWLQRYELQLDDISAAFCLLSAADRHGYPMYWAAAMSEEELRDLLIRELAMGRAVPCQSVAYVVGTFFWDDRGAILRPNLNVLSPAPRRAAEKVIRARSRDDFLTSSRWNSRLRIGDDHVRVPQLLDDEERALEIFTALVQADLDGSASQSEIGFAKQLDLVAHAR